MIQAVLNELRLTWRLIRDARVPVWAKLIPLGVLAYIVSPIDLLPDVIIGLGQLDDLGVLLAGLRLFQSVSPAHVVEEHRAALHGPEGEVIDAPSYSVRHKES